MLKYERSFLNCLSVLILQVPFNQVVNVVSVAGGARGSSVKGTGLN